MQQKRLLVVDDSATTRMLLALSLRQKRNYEVVEAADGNQAIEKLDQGAFDAVLTDVSMPNMDGLELIAHIRAHHLRPDLPIVVITTKGENGPRAQAMALGANAYVSKPVSQVELLSLLESILKVPSDE